MSFLKRSGYLFILLAVLIMAKPVMGCYAASHLQPEKAGEKVFLINKLLSKRKQDFLWQDLADNCLCAAQAPRAGRNLPKRLPAIPVYKVHAEGRLTRSMLFLLHCDRAAPPLRYLLLLRLSI